MLPCCYRDVTRRQMCCLLSLFHAKNEFKLILFNCSRCWNVKSSMNDPFNLKGTENDTENRDRSDCVNLPQLYWKINRIYSLNYLSRWMHFNKARWCYFNLVIKDFLEDLTPSQKAQQASFFFSPAAAFCCLCFFFFEAMCILKQFSYWAWRIKMWMIHF